MALGDGGQPRWRRYLKVVPGHERSVTRRLTGFWRSPSEAHGRNRIFTELPLSQENLH